MAYTGTIPSCGCIVSATVDNPEHRRQVAKDVAEMVRDGLTVDRRTVDDLRADQAFLRDCGNHGRVAP